MSTYSRRYLQLGDMAENLSVQELKEFVSTDALNKDVDFIKFAEEYRDELKAAGKHGSLTAVNSVYNNLKEFKPSLTFKQIDVKLLKSFETFLRGRGVENAVNIYMRYFRLIFNRGRDNYNDENRGIIRIPHYPFRKYKISKPENRTRENCLTADHLKSIINLSCH